MTKIHRYDDFWLKIADWIIRQWNRFAGTDNVNIARFLLKVGTLFALAAICGEYITSKHRGGDVFVFVLFTIIYVYIYWDTKRLFKKIEDTVDKQKDGVFTFMLTEMECANLMFRGRVFTFLTPISIFSVILTHSYVGLTGDIAILAIGLSIYIALCITPRKEDHALAKAWNKVKSLAKAGKEKAKDLIPSPIPAPVPIGVKCSQYY